jgi:histidinol-phosphate/aromatic aminotransferase/cobyric acid decarboxylase-like protein
MLQFSINHFTQVFARTILFSPEFQKCAKNRVKTMITERERMYRMLNARIDPNTLKVFKSAGNFLLIRVHQDTSFQKLMTDLDAAGIKVLNTSPFPLLRNTFRVSIGTAEENDFFLQKLSESLDCVTLRKKTPIILSGGYFPMAVERRGIRLAS